jgi:streptogramin lyase
LTRRLAPALAALACAAAVPASAGAAPGDIGVADEGTWMGISGRVLRMGAGGATSLLTAGAPLSDPWAVAVAADGSLVVVDEGAESVFSVDPAGKLATVVSGGGLQDPSGIALAPDGKAYLSDRQRDEVLKLDLATGALTHVADVPNAMGLALDKAGKLLVADGTALRRVDPGTGAVTTLAQGAPLVDPRDVAVALDGALFVAGDRRVVRVNPGTGAKTLLSSGEPLVDPRAIDIQPDGDLVVADGRSAGGAVIHVDRATGAKTFLARGGMFRVPAGVAVVGGAGLDPSGGGNGDPDGPAAPPPPPPPADPGGGDTPGGGGTPGGGTPGPGGTIIVTNPDGTTTVTRPDGTVVTLPVGVTPGTSGIEGIDFAAPFVGKPRLSSTRFRAARRGRAFAAVSIGTRIFYTLNEAARVLISVQKYRAPSRVCRRARGSRHRTGTRCRRWISLKGRYAKASVAGISSVRFRGRLKGRTLKPGRYRFVIRARDGAGNVSKPRRPKFRIVR